mmetsp:Transcript_51439/g.135734  ORF Transcript_51439/g.135734 Transcript_51439/m.135734 type:complete len:208 (+) Transcript_51439:1298-1921(+)
MIDTDRGTPGVSLREAIAANNPKHVKDATMFLSWTWRYKVREFLQALKNYCIDQELEMADCYVWVCFFCNNQFQWLSGEPHDGVETFGETVKQIGNVVCVLDTFKAVESLYFSRLWTVFEVFTACAAGVRIDFCLMGDSEDELMDTTLRMLTKSVIIDVMNAQASDKRDELKIKGLITATPDGAETINIRVAQLFLDMAHRYMKTRL